MVLTNPQGGGPDTAIPIFYTKAVRDEAKYRETGVIEFVDQFYVEVIVPGSRDTHHTPVEPEHQARWPLQWQAFQMKKTAPIIGLPLGEWPGIGPADKATLEANHIRSVEQLANLPESNLTPFGPNIFQLKHKAIEFLAARGKWEGKEKAYEEEIAALKARLAELEAAPKKVKKVKEAA